MLRSPSNPTCPSISMAKSSKCKLLNLDTTPVDKDADVSKLDENVKNKFRWYWMLEKDSQGDLLGDYVVKIRSAGSAVCTWCNDVILYGSAGKKSFRAHAKSKKHTKRRMAAIKAKQAEALRQQEQFARKMKKKAKRKSTLLVYTEESTGNNENSELPRKRKKANPIDVTPVDEYVNIDALDSMFKNKFRWDWLSQQDSRGDWYGEYVIKINTPGYALCTWCNRVMVYGSMGVKSLKSHSSSSKHLKKRALYKPEVSTSAQEAIGQITPCQIKQEPKDVETHGTDDLNDLSVGNRVEQSSRTKVILETQRHGGIEGSCECECDSEPDSGKKSVCTVSTGRTLDPDRALDPDCATKPGPKTEPDGRIEADGVDNPGCAVGQQSPVAAVSAQRTAQQKTVRKRRPVPLVFTPVTELEEIFRIDHLVRNRFRWMWMSEVDYLGDQFGDYIIKISTPGCSMCTWCSDIILYGTQGKKAFRTHAKSQKHFNRRLRHTLNDQLTEKVYREISEEPQDNPYRSSGVRNAFDYFEVGPQENHETEGPSNSRIRSNQTTKELVSLEDRQSHAEARTLSFITEHSLPLDLVPELIRYAQDLGRCSLVRYPSQATPSACDFGKTKGLVVGVYKEDKNSEVSLTRASQTFQSKRGKDLSHLVKLSGLDKKGKCRMLYGLDEEYPSIAVVSLGKKGTGYNELEELDEGRESVRRAVAVGVRNLQENGVGVIDVDPCGDAEAAAEGALLSTYAYEELKAADSRKTVINLNCFTAYAEDVESTEASWQRGTILAEGQILAKRLMEMPANHLTPTRFADIANDTLGKMNTCTVTVRDRAWAEEKKMGAYLSVAAGSHVPPRFVEVEYSGGRDGEAPFAIVGKGITFDTGGISLKPSASMEEMRADMGGAACTLGALYAAARLKLPINIRGFMPLCENMPGGGATKPGDVVTSMSGKTIQIDNTDAEGRLILCDTLTYAQTFNPSGIIDMATLTGAIGVALGAGATGVYSTNGQLWETLHRAGGRTGDRMWRMPLFNLYSKQVKEAGHLADLNNISHSRAGGSCTAAAFLREFVTHDKWMHLDIAGVMGNKSEVSYLGKGMSGRPTRTVVEFLSQLSRK